MIESPEIDICYPPLSMASRSSCANIIPDEILLEEHSGATASEDTASKSEAVRRLFFLLHEQIKKLQGEEADDWSTQLSQLLMKFRADARLLGLEMAAGSSERKRKREHNVDSMALGKLLHEKVAAEVALMSIQVEREQVQLDRERMKTEVEVALSRKRLEDALVSKSTIDRIVARSTLGTRQDSLFSPSMFIAACDSNFLLVCTIYCVFFSLFFYSRC